MPANPEQTEHPHWQSLCTQCALWQNSILFFPSSCECIKPVVIRTVCMINTAQTLDGVRHIIITWELSEFLHVCLLASEEWKREEEELFAALTDDKGQLVLERPVRSMYPCSFICSSC